MGHYERQYVDVGSLQDGDVFELPHREGTVCQVNYTNLVEDTEDGYTARVRMIGYYILEGNLHWPVLCLPNDFQVVLLLPTTTTVQMPGKDWLHNLIDEHGVN